jgi:hypothetical protein
MSQGNDGNEGVVTSEFRRQNAVFSGSAGNNEGGAGTLETLRQLQIQHAVETKTHLDNFLALATPPLNRSPQL